MAVAFKPRQPLGYLAFAPYMLLVFIPYVLCGYYVILFSSFPNWPNVAIAAVAVLFVIWVLFLVLLTAKTKARAHAEGTGSKKWIIPFFFVLIFSGIGILETSMFFIQGPGIVRDNIDDVMRTLSQFKASALAAVRVPMYEELVARVRQKEDNFHNQFYNAAGGNNCGIGDSARDILKDIAKDLPNVIVIGHTDNEHDCRHLAQLDAIYKQYETSFRSGLANHTLATQFRIAELEKFSDGFSAQIDTENDNLLRLKEGLGGRFKTFLPPYGLPLYAQSVTTLEKAKAIYGSNMAELIGFISDRGEEIPPPVKALPKVLEISPTESLGGLPQLPSTIASRIFIDGTWAFVVLALFLDLLASHISSLLILRYWEIRDSIKDAAENDNIDGATGVRYIWVPMPHPDTRIFPHHSKRD
jgi:hypothetical protein